jgi:hypothetical protein
VRTWSAGTYHDLDEAVAVWDAWMPPREEVASAVNGEGYDLQIGLWVDGSIEPIRFNSEMIS